MPPISDISLQNAWVWPESPASSPSPTRQDMLVCFHHFVMTFNINIIQNKHITGYTHNTYLILLDVHTCWSCSHRKGAVKFFLPTFIKLFFIALRLKHAVKFQGSTYEACTRAGSVNGAAWCATQVSIVSLLFLMLAEVYQYVVWPAGWLEWRGCYPHLGGLWP